MYRCSACDAPAMLNCECFTQVELPTDELVEEFVTEHESVEKKNIGSGEDRFVTMVA